MNCAAVEWALAQTAPSSSAKLLLVAIASRVEDGVLQASQAELGRIVQLTDRSVRTALKLLEAAGLIKRTSNPGKGAGRVADSISLGQPEGQAETKQPEEFAADKKGQAESVSVATGKSNRSNRKNIPQQPEPIAATQAETNSSEAVSNPPAACIGTGARAETLTFITTVPEIHSGSVELVDTGSGSFELAAPPTSKPDKRGTRMTPDWRPGPSAVKKARELGIVNGWGEATLENFIDYWLGVSGAKGVSRDWDATYRNELRKEARARRHVPTQYSNAAEATHDRQRFGQSSDGANYGRRRRNLHTDLLTGDEPDDSPRFVGRVDFSAGK